MTDQTASQETASGTIDSPSPQYADLLSEHREQQRTIDALREDLDTLRADKQLAEGQRDVYRGRLERLEGLYIGFGCSLYTAAAIVGLCQDEADRCAMDPEGTAYDYGEDLADKLREKGFGAKDFRVQVTYYVRAIDSSEAERMVEDGEVEAADYYTEEHY